MRVDLKREESRIQLQSLVVVPVRNEVLLGCEHGDFQWTKIINLRRPTLIALKRYGVSNGSDVFVQVVAWCEYPLEPLVADLVIFHAPDLKHVSVGVPV